MLQSFEQRQRQIRESGLFGIARVDINDTRSDRDPECLRGNYVVEGHLELGVGDSACDVARNRIEYASEGAAAIQPALAVVQLDALDGSAGAEGQGQ